MRILVVHNRYQQPGGEDAVFAAEVELLRREGHEVVEYTDDNWRINGMSRLAVAAQAIWSEPTRVRLLSTLRDLRCDVAHFHNIFPLISPSAYSACREARVPVVQTLHNYRLVCPAATLYRAGRVCEDCLGKTPPWPAILHACYRNSRIQTAVVASMLTFHRWMGTWDSHVSVYVVFREFYRRKFIEAGLPTEKIVVKPHFVHPDPGMRQSTGSYAVFIGRLAPEKGVRTLLSAWKLLKNIPLKIRGDGPLLKEVREFLGLNVSSVEALPRLSRFELLSLIKGARFLVWPSEGFYETFGLVAAEAFASGVPVIASRLGAMEEMVTDGHTGLYFTSGDPEDLARQVEWAWNHPERMVEMGKEARQEYEAKYTADKNYSMLMDIYQRAIQTHRRG